MIPVFYFTPRVNNNSENGLRTGQEQRAKVRDVPDGSGIGTVGNYECVMRFSLR